MDPTLSPTNCPNPRLALKLSHLKTSTKTPHMTNPKLHSIATSKTAAHGGGAGQMMKSKVPAPPPPPRPLYRQRSSALDEYRDEAWQRRKGNHQTARRHQRSRSVSLTNDDLEELRGSIDLGFGFEPDSPVLDPRLSDALPALGLFCAVNRQYSDRLSRCSSSSSIYSEGDIGTCNTIFDPGDDPEMVKTRLKQWAQVVACSVRQFSGESN